MNQTSEGHLTFEGHTPVGYEFNVKSLSQDLFPSIQVSGHFEHGKCRQKSEFEDVSYSVFASDPTSPLRPLVPAFE